MSFEQVIGLIMVVVSVGACVLLLFVQFDPKRPPSCVILAALLVFMATSARAVVDCDALVVDGGRVLTDVSQVEQAARRLASQGATVRIRTFGDVGGKGNMDRHVVELRDYCRDWQSPDGKGWKSTMLVMAYANEGRQKGVYYGPAIQPKVGDGKWINVLKNMLVPMEVAYFAGEKAALTQGFVASIGGLQSLMAAPVGGGGNVTINNTNKTDYSGVWKMFFILVGLVISMVGFTLWMMERKKVNAAQREAKRVRALCVSGLSEVSSQTTEDVLGAIIESETDASKQVVLRRKLAEFKQFVSVASNTLSSFDNMHGNDPNDARLSVEAYETNKKLYMNIVDNYITPAKGLMEQVKAKDVAEPSGYRVRQTQKRSYSKNFGFPQGSNPATTAYPQPGSSTVVHHHYDSSPVFVPTPVVVVERESYSPSRSSYSRSDDSGSSSSYSGSSSSDSGGSYSSSDSGSSSSDSGGSFGGGD